MNTRHIPGAVHNDFEGRLKTESQILLERFVAAGERIVTDAEVLQEILHRYTAINRRDAIAPAVKAVLAIVDEARRGENHELRRRLRSLARPHSSV